MSRSKWAPIGAGVGLLMLIAVSASLLSGSSSTGPSDEQPAIIAAAREAMVARQQIGAVNAVAADPDGNVDAVVRPGRYSKVEQPDLRTLTTAQIAGAQAAGNTRLASTFTGAELGRVLSFSQMQPQRYQALMIPDGEPGSPAVDPSVTADYVLTGGADNFDVSSVLYDSDNGGATVSGTATIWVNEAMIQGESTEVANARNDVTFELHVTKVGPDWKVDSYKDEFVPGSGP